MFDYRDSFCLGINYWPIQKAMYWWKNYDRTEVERDFAQLARYKLQQVRIFLTWEDFQPHPDLISKTALENLLWTADCASRFSLTLVPTFFCGHMSGVNWIPDWMLESTPDLPARFPIFCQNSLQSGTVKNFYADEELILAQIEQISAVSKLLNGHPAINSFDLGNEASNLAIPLNREQACSWLEKMVSSIKKFTSIPVTLGMHAEDLEEDRHLWPQDAGTYCDYLCMHAYPFYLSWVENPFDYLIVPFLSIITKWLGQKTVIMQEFGLPTIPLIEPLVSGVYRQNLKSPLWDEDAAAWYYAKVLAALYDESIPAALAWCYADYSPHLYGLPPLNGNNHERHFGLFRHNGNPKKIIEVFKEDSWVQYLSGGKNNDWLAKYDRDTFYLNPRDNLQKMFFDYKSSHKGDS